MIDSAWATSAIVLALGIACAVSAAGHLYTSPQPRGGEILRAAITAIGAFGLGAGLFGVLFGSVHALELLVMATIILWAAATFWHVLHIGSDQ